MRRHNVEIADEKLAEFCRAWKITELALFGSVLRNDFRPDSDVDFLVTYAPDTPPKSWGYYPEQQEMQTLIGRKVDWVTRKSIEQGRNPVFRREVLGTAEIIYAEHG